MGKSVAVGGDDENNEWLVEDVDDEFKADLNAENDSVDSEDDYPAEEHAPIKVGAKQAAHPAGKRKADSSADADDVEQQLAKKSKKQDKFRALKEKRREVMSSSAAQPAAVVAKAAASVSSGFADDLSLAAIADKLRVSSQSQQAAHFRQLLPGLPQRSELEAAASQLKESHFISMSSSFDRTAAQFHHHVKHFCRDWARVLSGQNGTEHTVKFTAGLTASPVLLVVTHNAMRAVDFIKSMQCFKKDDVPIGKLFARHLKLDEQIAQLRGEAKRIRVAVGTVNRILKLLDSGALSIERTRYLVVDCEQTVKKLLIFNMPDSRLDFLRLFTNYIEPRVIADKMAIGMY